MNRRNITTREVDTLAHGERWFLDSHEGIVLCVAFECQQNGHYIFTSLNSDYPYQISLLRSHLQLWKYCSD